MAIFGNWENLVRHGAHALPPKLSIAISSRHREHFLSLAIQNFYDSDLPLDEVSWMIRQYLLLCKDRDYSLKMGNQTEARVFGKAAWGTLAAALYKGSITLGPDKTFNFNHMPNGAQHIVVLTEMAIAEHARRLPAGVGKPGKGVKMDSWTLDLDLSHIQFSIGWMFEQEDELILWVVQVIWCTHFWRRGVGPNTFTCVLVGALHSVLHTI